MHIEVMHTAECPNANNLLAYLAARHDLTVLITLVTADRPVPEGFAGSPTVLIDGQNPFGGRPVESPACAVHSPTISQIDRYITQFSGACDDQ